MSFRSALISAALVAGFATPASAVTNLIVNGDFETGTFAGWTTNFTSGGSSISGTLPLSVPYAARLRTVNMSLSSSIAQTIATQDGYSYRLDYYLFNSGNSPVGVDAWTAVSGATTTVFGDRAPFGYTLFSQIFTGTTGGSTLIEFVYNHEFHSTFYLDDVSVSVVPEPAAWGLMVAGFGMIGFAMRRRVRTVAA